MLCRRSPSRAIRTPRTVRRVAAWISSSRSIYLKAVVVDEVTRLSGAGDRAPAASRSAFLHRRRPQRVDRRGCRRSSPYCRTTRCGKGLPNEPWTSPPGVLRIRMSLQVQAHCLGWAGHPRERTASASASPPRTRAHDKQEPVAARQSAPRAVVHLVHVKHHRYVSG